MDVNMNVNLKFGPLTWEVWQKCLFLQFFVVVIVLILQFES